MTSRLPPLNDRVLTFRDAGGTNAGFGTNRNIGGDGDIEIDIDPGPRSLGTRGADGLASAVWTIADGQVVVHPRSSIRRGLRRRPLSSFEPGRIPESVVPLSTVVTELDHDLSAHVVLTVADDRFFEPMRAVLDAAPAGVVARVWLSHDDPAVLQRWRPRTDARLVNSMRSVRTAKGFERRVAHLHELGVDAVSAAHKEWSGGSIAMAHRFGVLAFAVGAEHEREFAVLVDAGIDGLVSSHVDRMLAVVARYHPGGGPARS